MSQSPTIARMARARRRTAVVVAAGISLGALGAPGAARAAETSAAASPVPALEGEPFAPASVNEGESPVLEGDAHGPGSLEDPSAFEFPDGDGPATLDEQPADGEDPAPGGPTPTPTPAGADVFSSSFWDGLSEFPYRYNTHRISIVDDPRLGSARKVLRFRVYQGDTGVTSNPRAQLETPYTFDRGEDRYFGYSVNLAQDFPTGLPSYGWVTLVEPAYGPPYSGASPFALRVQNQSGTAVVRWQRNASYNHDIPWTGPRVADVRGRWLDFVIRIKLHGDPSIGFVELWMNKGTGWIKQSLHGRSRLYMRTYDSSNNGGTNNSRVLLYYRRDIPGPLTMFHGPLRIASASSTAFAAVAPTSYR